LVNDTAELMAENVAFVELDNCAMEKMEI